MILKAIYHYCHYQERSHKEVRNKLYDLGCKTDEVNQYISILIEEGLLNEERYAKAIVRGRFRLKQWGKTKIIQQLKSQDVSEYNIKAALKEIGDEEYLDILKTLVVKKLSQLDKERNPFLKKKKIYSYLLQKGYESGLITDVINEIIK